MKGRVIACLKVVIVKVTPAHITQHSMSIIKARDKQHNLHYNFRPSFQVQTASSWLTYTKLEKKLMETLIVSRFQISDKLFKAKLDQRTFPNVSCKEQLQLDRFPIQAELQLMSLREISQHDNSSTCRLPSQNRDSCGYLDAQTQGEALDDQQMLNPFDKNKSVLFIMEESPEEKKETLQEQEDNEMDKKFFHYREIRTFEGIPPNTIDDGVCESLGREFTSMGYKFSFVLCPRSKGADELRSWDLWGPFFMCLVFGLFINNATEFLLLFLAAFGGAVIVTFNTRTLGGRISFFQSVAILGYCIFPLFIAGVLLKVLQMIGFQHIIMKVAVMVAGAFWGVFSAQVFIAFNIDESKRGVAVYPILLFYLFIGFMVLYM